jgi:glycosyltransferase involved in cell wall biosynthesis
MPKSTHVLFVSWDGPHSFYLESLFLPFFKLLAQRGIFLHVLQFTWADNNEKSDLKVMLESHGITYQAISILRRPLSVGSLITMLCGSRYIRRAIKAHCIDIVMPRSTLPAMASILALKNFPEVGLLFDADGLPHDERVDFGGVSPNSITYRMLRDFEAVATRRADSVLTRSKKAIDILMSRAGAGINPDKFHVVTNGRDDEIFKPFKEVDRQEVRRSLNIQADAPLLVYIGSSIQGKYCGKELFEFFRIVHRKRNDTHLLLLTSSLRDAELFLNEYEELRPFCHIKHLQPRNVPRYLSACDLGLVLIHQKFSMQAVSAIKLGEYLLCGVPVLVSAGIGDSDELITDDVGYLLVTMSPEKLDAAADWFLNIVLADRDKFRQLSRESGLKHYTLQASVNVYDNLIKSIENRRNGS